MTEGLPQAGWYDDPEAPGRQRWWDGQQWARHRAFKPVEPVSFGQWWGTRTKGTKVWVLVGSIVPVVVVGLAAAATAPAAPAPSDVPVQAAPTDRAEGAAFTSELMKATALTPSIMRIWVHSTNVGAGAGHESCTFHARNATATASEIDIGESPVISPGKSRDWYVDLIVTNRGAYDVADTSIECI